MLFYYFNIPLLTEGTADEGQLKVLRQMTLFGLLFFLLLLTLVVLTESGRLKLSERVAQGIGVAVLALLMLFTGLLAPRIPFNRHTGLRLPWTVADEETWYLAHRLLGYISLPLCVLYIAGTFLPVDFKDLSVATLALWIGLPALVSGVFYWRKFR